jgi:hypothetical protein
VSTGRLLPLTSARAADRHQRQAVGMTLAMALATLLLTRQAQIPWMTGLAAPWALLLVFGTLRVTPSLAAGLPIMAYGAVSLIGSTVAGNDMGNALRFSTILIGTLLAFHVKPMRISAPWVLAPILLQALLITLVAVVLGALQDPLLASTVRFTSLERNWGDIYSFDGLYFRVQVIGNALLPLLFMICLWRVDQGRFYRWGLPLASIGLVAAGNLTYFITAGVALVVRSRKLLVRSLALRLLAGLAALATVAYTWSVADTLFERKFDGTDSSMGVRFDQVAVAAEHMTRSPTTLLLGAGIGAKFPDGRERAYSEYQYIELQALYLTYQIGLVGMLLYTVTAVWAARHALNRDGRQIFWLYVLAGLSNPYILDTNQIVATLMLVHLFPRATARHG